MINSAQIESIKTSISDWQETIKGEWCIDGESKEMDDELELVLSTIDELFKGNK